jgi:hypothetical protein
VTVGLKRVPVPSGNVACALCPRSAAAIAPVAGDTLTPLAFASPLAAPRERVADCTCTSTSRWSHESSADSCTCGNRFGHP